VNRPPARTNSAWIVNHYAASPDQPTLTRHYDLARELVASGRRVTIFAAGRSHVTGRERLTGWGIFGTESFDDVRFVWLRTSSYRGNTWRRKLNMLTFVVAFLVVQIRFESPDVIIGSTVHPFAALGAWIAARIRRVRFVLEIRDLWPQTLVDLGEMRIGSSGERLLRSIEAFLVTRASTTITLLPGMRDYLSSRGLRTDHVVYIPNGVRTSSDEQPCTASEREPVCVREAFGTIQRMRDEGRFVIGYAGAFGFINRADVIAKAAAIAEERSPGRVGLFIFGDGPERAKLEAAAAGNSAVAIGAAVPKRYVRKVLEALDATVLHVADTPVFRYGMSPNKLFDYMGSARPVAFACSSAYDPVATVGAGISVRPDDPALLGDAYLRLASTPPDTLARMGAAGREYVVREHNIERLAETLAFVLWGQHGEGGSRP
jgi:glycosyltransferase involved in cell wall biosynthesis